MQKKYIEDLRNLVRKYLNNKATSQQKEALEKYYDIFTSQDEITDQLDGDEIQSLNARIKGNISSRIHHQTSEKTNVFRLPYWRIAAVFIGILGFVGLFYKLQMRTLPQSEQVTSVMEKRSDTNRFLILPDGSKVILRNGSKLSYSKDFNKTTREVTLVGEAYFDITHIDTSAKDGSNSPRPFIIHTGKIKTTVLGTAFVVKAWPEMKKIVVTVSRGKVRVEDEKQVIAILTEDKQVDFSTETMLANKTNVNAAQVLSWTQDGMTFDNMTFKMLADQLGKRYDVQISFKNSNLERCPFTGRFNGTESLKEVMDILAATSKTSYRIDGQQVVIDGNECN